MVEESKPRLEYAVSNSLFPVFPIGVIRKSSFIAWQLSDGILQPLENILSKNQEIK